MRGSRVATIPTPGEPPPLPRPGAEQGRGPRIQRLRQSLRAYRRVRARHLVPQATFLHADATQIAFPSGAFDAVVCLYAPIHVPLAEQPRLLSRIANWLRPGGLLLATTGAQAWTGSQDHWLGGPAPMWWSHADAASYRDWIVQAGLHIESEDFVPEADSGHQLVWAHRPRWDPAPAAAMINRYARQV